MQLNLFIAACIFGAVSSQPGPAVEYDKDIGNVAYYYAFTSYCSESTINNWDLKGSPPDEVQQFEPTAVIHADESRLQCFVGWDPVRSRIVISVRGSKVVSNWWRTNLQIVSTKYKNDYANTGAKVHSGFYAAFADLEDAGLTDAILQIVDDHPGANVLTSGHSLGAAIASIAALELKMSPKYRDLPIGAVDVITFASPRWGNEQTVNLFRANIRRSWRIVNGNDVVVAVPPESFGYRHVGMQIQYKEGSADQFFKCDGTGTDDACHGTEFVDIFGLNVPAHNDYFGRGMRSICDCDEEYSRGAGHGLDACPASHPEKDAGLCYPICNEGYWGTGPVCWERCSANEVNDGAFCRIPLVTVTKHNYVRLPAVADGCGMHRTRQNGLCYNRCRSGYQLHGPLCLKNCDGGYEDHGLSCYKNVFNFYFKSSYGNGGGIAPKDCPSGKEKASDGLCYNPCNDGYYGVLGVCTQNCDGIDLGVLCQTQALSTRAKKTHPRGVGVPLQCGPDEEQVALVCYPKCREGFRGSLGKCKPFTCVTPTPQPTPAPVPSTFIPTLQPRRIYIGYVGKQCGGSSTDILRDYIGTADDCQTKCDEMNCIGFVRVNSGTFAGKCYFRGGAIGNAYAYSGDDRDCYIPWTRRRLLDEKYH